MTRSDEPMCSKFIATARAVHDVLLERTQALSERVESGGLAKEEVDALEQAWIDYLSIEEELLIPACELSSPVEVEAVRVEHQSIRRGLCALSGAPPALASQALATLIQQLRVTTKFSPGHLYAEADSTLRPRAKGELIHRLRAPLAASVTLA